MKRLVIAIIGYGKSAQRYHLPFIRLREEIKVKYICDLTLSDEAIDLLAKEGIIGTRKLELILADEEVELVTICTPPTTHFQLAEVCLKGQKNVVVEKPICETLEETKELYELAERNQVLLTPYQNRRFDSDYLTLKKVIDHHYLDDLIELEAHIDYYRPNEEVRRGSFVDGSFYALGIHAVDQTVALFGKPESVLYDLRNVQHAESEVDDYYEVQLIYGKLKVILKSSQLVAKAGPRFRLLGKNGAYEKQGTDQQENDLKAGLLPEEQGFGLDTPDEYGRINYRNGNGDWISRRIASESGDYGRFYDCVYKSIIEKQPFIVTKQEVLTTMEIMEGADFAHSPTILKMN